MKPISPVLPSNPQLPESVFGKDQPEYIPLPGVKVGYQHGPNGQVSAAVITRYQLTPEELAEVQRTGCLWLEVWTIDPRAPLQPQRLTVYEPLTQADQVQGHEAKSGFVHYAGPYADGVQRCIACGGIIVDDRGAVGPEGQPSPKGFPEGPVTVLGNMRGAYTDDTLPACPGLGHHPAEETPDAIEDDSEPVACACARMAGRKVS